jgi:hypothetical protein
LLAALDFDQSPREMGALSTVLVTALGSLSREAKADVTQFLAEPQGAPSRFAREIAGLPFEPQGAPRACLCGNTTGDCGCAIDH